MNTTVEQNDIDLSELTLGDLIGTENVADITDIGGIAGLSTGITAQLCLAAKLVLIFTMYTGRVGAFTLLSLWVERPEPNAHFTEEAITIG